MEAKDHKKEVEILNALEDQLIKLIAGTDNSDLMDKFSEWQTQRAVCNESWIKFVEDVISPTEPKESAMELDSAIWIEELGISGDYMVDVKDGAVYLHDLLKNFAKEFASNSNGREVTNSWLDHHVLTEDSEVDGVIIKHHSPGAYGGVAVKTAIGNFAIVKEDQEKAAKNKGERVRVKPHKGYYGTVMIISYLPTNPQD